MKIDHGKCLESALALTAACIGAGFATGREILSFFTRFGAPSWAGCAAAAVLLGLLCAAAAACARMRCACDLSALCCGVCGGMGKAAAMLYGALYAAVGGAMLAAVGEMSALTLPVRHAEEIGVFAAALICFLLRNRGLRPIAVLGAGLAPCCAVLFLLLLRVPPQQAQPYPAFSPGWLVFPSAACYAGLNASLAAGMMCEIGRERGRREIAVTCAMAAVLFGGMLLLGNAAMTRHFSQAAPQALPTVVLSRALGAAGYRMCAACILLAVLTSCMAAVRALARMLPMPETAAWAAALFLVLLAARLDFSGLIGSVYPLLGAACLLMFLRILFRMVKGCS